MEFRIADTFTDSLAKLTGDEQKAVKTTAFDLQMNPANPGMQFHKLDKSPDKNFWSVRVSRDIRLIVHRTGSSLLLCYVDHHDNAYAWAERRKLERHPKTGAAQLVEVREKVVEIPTYVPGPAEPELAVTADDRPQGALEQAAEVAEPPVPVAPVLEGVSDEQLLGYGVPADWVDEIRSADEDGLLELAELLPEEAAEAVLALAIGEMPAVRPRDHRCRDRRLRASGCPAPLPGHRGRGGAGTGTGVPAGALGGLSAPASARGRREGLQRPCAGRRLGRNRQDGRGTSSRRPPGAPERNGKSSADDVLSRACQTAATQSACARARGEGASAGGADHGRVDDRRGDTALPGAAGWARSSWPLTSGFTRRSRKAWTALDHPRFTEAFLRSEWEHVVDGWQLRSA